MYQVDYQVFTNGVKVEEGTSNRKYRNPTEIRITVDQGEFLRIEEWANYFKCSPSEAIRILLTSDFIEETLREALSK